MILMAAVASPEAAIEEIPAGARVGVVMGVAVISIGAGLVSAGGGKMEVAATAGGGTGVEGGCVPSSGGIFKVMPTRRRVESVSAFALMIKGYLLPFPYTFCAIIQGLSPLCTMYVVCPGVRGAAGTLGVSPGYVGMKMGVGKTYGGLAGSSVGMNVAAGVDCATGAAMALDART